MIFDSPSFYPDSLLTSSFVLCGMVSGPTPCSIFRWKHSSCFSMFAFSNNVWAVLRQPIMASYSTITKKFCLPNYLKMFSSFCGTHSLMPPSIVTSPPLPPKWIYCGIILILPNCGIFVTPNWQIFDDALCRAPKIWENNQYPPQFTQPIVRATLSKLLGRESETTNRTDRTPGESKAPLVMQYRGKISDQFSRRLKIQQAVVSFSRWESWKLPFHP